MSFLFVSLLLLTLSLLCHSPKTELLFPTSESLHLLFPSLDVLPHLFNWLAYSHPSVISLWVTSSAGASWIMHHEPKQLIILHPGGSFTCAHHSVNDQCCVLHKLNKKRKLNWFTAICQALCQQFKKAHQIFIEKMSKRS